MSNLQLFLGIDKNNPLFSIYSSENNPELLEVYFGMALLEKVEKGKNSFHFKLLVGRLYNMRYRRQALVEAFGVDLKTIRKWGTALKSGELRQIEAAYGGHENRRKLTAEINSYVRSRFKEIYRGNQYNYSRIIRDELSEHFQTRLSAETLRPLFNEEKARLSELVPAVEKAAEKDGLCDCPADLSSSAVENRNHIPCRPEPESGERVFLHHAGIMLFLPVIFTLTAGLPLMRLSRQWLMSVLLGAVNIEQSMRLDFGSLAQLAGMDFLTSPRHQRGALKAGSTEYNRILLFRRNAAFVDADRHRYFYYDPHGVPYTGIRKLLKGWCGSIGKIARVYYQDFIHDSSGNPVFFKSFDNYYDLRERFHVTVSEFAQTLTAPLRRLVFVIDRGIYGKDVLSRINDNGDTLITWEKGYARDGWSDKLPVCHFKITRYRNNFQDTVSCDFNCVRYPSKIPGYDRIIVRASRGDREDIEVSVLVNDKNMTTRETVTAIFSRWIQENDFLYEIRHFGINQITSYDFEDYGSLKESLIEKTAWSDEYISQKIMLNSLNKTLMELLIKKENGAGKATSMKNGERQRINTLKEEIKESAKAIKLMEKKCIKEDKLIKNGAQKLNTEPKQYMDIVKISARNIFFGLFEKFRPLYNNFRNDHVMLRALTRAPGFVTIGKEKITVELFPAITVQPKVRQAFQLFLDQAGGNDTTFNGGKIEFRLGRQIKGGIYTCDCTKTFSPSK